MSESLQLLKEVNPIFVQYTTVMEIAIHGKHY